MKKFIIEVEENKAETIINLLATVSVKIDKPAEKKKRYVRVKNYNNTNFLCLTEDQFGLLSWLLVNDYFEDWEEVEPDEIFEEI